MINGTLCFVYSLHLPGPRISNGSECFEYCELYILIYNLPFYLLLHILPTYDFVPLENWHCLCASRHHPRGLPPLRKPPPPPRPTLNFFQVLTLLHFHIQFHFILFFFIENLHDGPHLDCLLSKPLMAHITRGRSGRLAENDVWYKKTTNKAVYGFPLPPTRPQHKSPRWHPKA